MLRFEILMKRYAKSGKFRIKCVMWAYYGRKRSPVGVERDLGSGQKGNQPSTHVTHHVTRVEAMLRA